MGSAQNGNGVDSGKSTVWGRPGFGTAFDPRRNSLNFLRLLFATLVIVDHADGIGFLKEFPTIGNVNLGSIAVYCFFGISGYLIAGSAVRNRLDRFLWQRVLRIFPAFWVCLAVTAFVFGPIYWHHSGTSLGHIGFTSFVNTPTGPFRYVYHDALLKVNQTTISGTPISFGGWNGSLWTLFYEFICYLLLGALAVVGMLKRPVLVLWLTVAVIATEVALAVPKVDVSFDVGKLLSLVPIFLVGALTYLYRDRIPDSGLLALALFGLFLAGCWVPLGSVALDFTGINNGPAMFAPLLVYPVLWLGAHLPLQFVGSRNDYSYGMYIFAFPVQVMLVMWGLNRWGYDVYLVLSIVVTFPLAVASWWLIERNALKLKHRGPSELVSAIRRGRADANPSIAATVVTTPGDHLGSPEVVEMRDGVRARRE